ncbi:MAG: ROK family protein [Pseudonocardiales bacterium]|nr:ROK family protein [Pseudonocardiales bacterium]
MSRPSPGPAPAGPAALRRHNLGLVLAALRAAGGASRAELAATTGLTRATVGTLVEPLLAAGVLAEDAPGGPVPPVPGGAAPGGPRGVGRPARPVRVHPDGPVALGVTIEVDSLSACAVGIDGAVRARLRTARDHRDLAPDDVTDGAAALVTDLLGGLGERPRVLGAGLAVPALLGDAGGGDPVVRRAPNLPRLVGSRPGAALAARLGTPVTVGNEAGLGALAHLDVAPDFLYATADVGVGGGVVQGGRVLRGAHGGAGELGHVVVDPAGPACGCGGRGCVERYAGKAVVLGDAGVPDLDALAAALAAGDPAAAAAVHRAGCALGIGLASALALLDLPVVVLGGWFARFADALRPALEAELGPRSLQPAPPRLHASDRGESAAVLGAAESVLDEVRHDPDRLLAPG